MTECDNKYQPCIIEEKYEDLYNQVHKIKHILIT